MGLRDGVKMRKFGFISALLLLSFGCGSSDDGGASGVSASGVGGAGSSATTDASGTGGDSSSSDATTGAGGQGAGFEGPGVTGVLRDADGVPMVNETVLACSAATCFYKQSESDGRFSFELTPPVDVAVKTEEDLSVSPRRAAALVPVQILGNDPVDIGDVFVCNLPEGAPVGSGGSKTLVVGDGLELTVIPADLKAPLGFALVDLAACSIPDEHQHPIPGLEGEEVLAVYALHPFSGSSESPMAVRAPSDLPAGTAVNFRTTSWLDGHLSDIAKGHADGSFVETDPSEGIYDFTWLVISK